MKIEDNSYKKWERKKKLLENKIDGNERKAKEKKE